MQSKILLTGLVGLLIPALSHAGPVVRSASGASPTNIQATVDQFRADVSLGGTNNLVGGGPFANGRREINWDAVPDAFADTNQLPLNFFNNNSRRGALFATPGTSVSVSADSSNPSVTPTNFGGINASYRTNFQTFSPERLFSALGSTIVDVAFFVPNSPTNAATVSGFGAVFTDVEIAGSTKIEYLDSDGHSLGVFAAPVGPNGGLSFLGVSFDAGERVATVRITSGNTSLGTTNNDSGTADVVVMDDFIYSEPLADSDDDGVPDAFDTCPGTAPGEIVSATGCSIAQLVPCAGPSRGVSWKNHGEYVSSIAHIAQEFVRNGLMSDSDAAKVISAAAQSKCGQKSR